MYSDDEDGLTLAIRVVDAAELPAPKTDTKASTAFNTGFEMAKRVILAELKAEQDRRWSRRVIK